MDRVICQGCPLLHTINVQVHSLSTPGLPVFFNTLCFDKVPHKTPMAAFSSDITETQVGERLTGNENDMVTK